mgnify:CR=1 FL=1
MSDDRKTSHTVFFLLLLAVLFFLALKYFLKS